LPPRSSRAILLASILSFPLLGFQQASAGREGFAGWLYKVLYNDCACECRELVRYRQRFKGNLPELDQAPAPDREETLEEAARLRELVLSLDSLKEEERTVLLGLLDGKSGLRIAEECGHSSSWVARKKQEGLARLREHFRAEGGL
jgi:DNA-directed RNA polymerase specialized sigma24 family protein